MPIKEAPSRTNANACSIGSSTKNTFGHGLGSAISNSLSVLCKQTSYTFADSVPEEGGTNLLFGWMALSKISSGVIGSMDRHTGGVSPCPAGPAPAPRARTRQGRGTSASNGRRPALPLRDPREPSKCRTVTDRSRCPGASCTSMTSITTRSVGPDRVVLGGHADAVDCADADSVAHFHYMLDLGASTTGSTSWLGAPRAKAPDED